MPDNDAQKKELEQAEDTEQLSAQAEGTGGTAKSGSGAVTDAQKKEIQEN